MKYYRTLYIAFYCFSLFKKYNTYVQRNKCNVKKRTEGYTHYFLKIFRESFQKVSDKLTFCSILEKLRFARGFDHLIALLSTTKLTFQITLLWNNKKKHNIIKILITIIISYAIFYLDERYSLVVNEVVCRKSLSSGNSGIKCCLYVDT